MSEKLLKIAFAWSMIGVLLLIVIAWATSPELVSISSLQDSLGKTVVVQGAVTKFNVRAKVTFISLKDASGATTAVLFDMPNDYLDKGDIVNITGKVEEYKGDLELVASRVVCVDC